MLQHALLASLLLYVTLSTTVDVGYELLFTTSNAPVERTCYDLDDKIDLNGTYMVPSTAQMEMGIEKFTTILDAFGRMNRIEFIHNQFKLCVTQKMLDTKFYNRSKELDAVAPGSFFTETDPPRKCPGPLHLPGCNVIAMMEKEVDNTYVNTIKIGDSFFLVTDTHDWVEIDMSTLHIKGNAAWKQSSMDMKTMHITEIGSAHPLPLPMPGTGSNGDYISLKVNAPVRGSKTFVELFTVHSDTSPLVEDTLATVETSILVPGMPGAYIPYVHSFGLTADLGVITFQPLNMNMDGLFKGKMLADMFEDVPQMASTVIVITSIDGKNTQEVYIAPERFWFVHTINTYVDDDKTIVMDVTTADQNPLTSPAVNIPINLNKTARDAGAKSFGMSVTRLRINRATKEVILEPLTTAIRSTDFTRINTQYSGIKYCYFYANEWSHNLEAYGSMAVLKYNLCAMGKEPVVTYWRRHGWFPSEPIYVPREEPQAEDDGYIIFVALNGAAEESSLVILNSTTMKTIHEQVLPSRIAFTTHGQFFRNTLPSVL